MFERYLGPPTVDRSKSQYLRDDIINVQRIAQAAVDVELFTVPLYMTSMYSITGMHEINSAGNDFYDGRKWPGAKTGFTPAGREGPDAGNQHAFNLVFSVFIQEMLHLQMAANIATAVGLAPSFTDLSPASGDYAWTCYGASLSVIPNIVDLKDTDEFSEVAVDVGPLDENQIDLFLAIELPTEDAEEKIVRNKDKYFPDTPFKNTSDPMWFGSIGFMYECYKKYLNITYDDGSTLWDQLFLLYQANGDEEYYQGDPETWALVHDLYKSKGQQNDLFNVSSFPGHPMREYPGFESMIALTNGTIARAQIERMMNAITDQGEGSTLSIRRKLLANDAVAEELLSADAVKRRYRSSEDGLISDYPSYDGSGRQLEPSADAHARYGNDGIDHYHRFQEVKRLLLDDKIVLTWDRAGKAGQWTADDLKTDAWSPTDNIPSPDEVAGALNQLYAEDQASGKGENFKLVSQAVVGALKGITTVLGDYWNPASAGSTVGFPFPSMAGSGDRMSSCWAIFGKTPDLSAGVPDPNQGINHACQGLQAIGPDGFKGTNTCAEIAVFHTCRGSNTCKGTGGCGFVQLTGGGGGCGALLAAAPPQAGGNSCSAIQMRALGGVNPAAPRCGGPGGGDSGPSATHFTAPSDNVCGGLGGCAVPISASQLYPKDGTMDVYKMHAGLCGASEFIGNIDFKTGQKVDDIAYQAYAMWAKSVGQPPPERPPPNALRLAFPPST
jgi:hypothetical protein